MLSYEGIFFEGETVDFIHSLETEQLPIINNEIHCTFKYHPSESEIFDELVSIGMTQTEARSHVIQLRRAWNTVLNNMKKNYIII